MAKDGFLEMKGVVKEVLPNTRFWILLENNVKIKGYISGKLRRYYIKILLGDKVLVQISPYDLTKGRIIKRFNVPKPNPNSANNRKFKKK